MARRKITAVKHNVGMTYDITGKIKEGAIIEYNYRSPDLIIKVEERARGCGRVHLITKGADTIHYCAGKFIDDILVPELESRKDIYAADKKFNQYKAKLEEAGLWRS